MKTKVSIITATLVSAYLFFGLENNIIHTQDNMLRIIKQNAVLYLKPNAESPVIKKLPLGSVFEIAEISEGWIKINLPSNEDGFVVSGYVLRSAVEVDSDPEGREKVVKIKLIDGSILNGKLLAETDEKVKLELVFGTFDIEKNLILDLEFSSQNQVDQTADSEVKTGDIVSLKSVDVPPELIKSVAPKYRWDETLLVTEKFYVNVLISENGDVQDAKMMQENKTYAPINEAVLKAVKQWKYKPAMKNGFPVKVWKVVVLRVNRRKSA